MDPSYNHVYYFNVSTGQRTWEKPAAAPKASKAEPPAQVKPHSALPPFGLNCMRGGPSGRSGSPSQRNKKHFLKLHKSLI